MRESKNIGQPNAAQTPSAAALYIASIVDELAQMAKHNGLESLGYLLDMARLEADEVSKSATPASRCA